MSDFRDTRGGAYDHVNQFGNPQPPQVKDRMTPHQKTQWARTCDLSRYQDRTKDTHSLRDCGSREWVRSINTPGDDRRRARLTF
jgi:hypothetical protein